LYFPISEAASTQHIPKTCRPVATAFSPPQRNNWKLKAWSVRSPTHGKFRKSKFRKILAGRNIPRGRTEMIGSVSAFRSGSCGPFGRSLIRHRTAHQWRPLFSSAPRAPAAHPPWRRRPPRATIQSLSATPRSRALIWAELKYAVWHLRASAAFCRQRRASDTTRA
jgi:hypothetical protein